MSDRFQELNVFIRAAELSSFSAAARELGLSQPSVSRIVSELELRLGTRLLLRSTRRIVLTDAGAQYLGRARLILHDLDEADDGAKGTDSLRGQLRVALPSILAVKTVIPSLADFCREHPLLHIELLTSDGMHDLVAEAADMAIRFGPLADSAFGAKKLAVERRLLVASPVYLEQRGIPKEPNHLLDHVCVSGPGGSASKSWIFTKDGQEYPVIVEPKFRVTSAEAVLACAREGLGITIASAWMCRCEIEAGTLVSLFPDFKLDPVDVYAVFPAGRSPSNKVRLFTNFLGDVLSRA